jgi:hypothetical protein
MAGPTDVCAAAMKKGHFLACGGGLPRSREQPLTGTRYCPRVYLEVTLANGHNYSIPIERGHSVGEELELFLQRQGRYAGEWVPLQKAGRELFVRYEQIVLVSPKTEGA